MNTERDNPWEFAIRVFSNESLRAKLNALSLPGSKLTLMQQIRRLLAALGFGGKEIRAGSMLEEAMRQTIKVAGTTAVTGEGTAAMSQVIACPLHAGHERIPAVPERDHQCHCSDRVHDMGITAEERKKDFENAHYTDEERTAMTRAWTRLLPPRAGS